MTNTLGALMEVYDHGEVVYDPQYHDVLLERGLLQLSPLGGNVTVTQAGVVALGSAIAAAGDYLRSLPIRTES